MCLLAQLLSYFFKFLLCLRSLLKEFDKFFTFVVNAVTAVFNVFFHSAFPYLTDTAVINMSSITSQTTITVYFFRLYLSTKKFRPSLCNISPFRIIIFLRRYESLAIRTNQSTKSNHILQSITSFWLTITHSLTYKAD